MTFPRKTEGGLLPKRAEDGGGHARRVVLKTQNMERFAETEFSGSKQKLCGRQLCCKNITSVVS